MSLERWLCRVWCALAAVWLAAGMLGLTLLLSDDAKAASIPRAALAYKRPLIRHAHAFWGLDAPISLFAGLIHQESRWNPKARSPAKAEGLAQFMPATCRWLPEVESGLAACNAFDPHWSLEAMVRYNRRQYRAIRHTANDCERWAMTLSAYNGGLGWVNRDRRLCKRHTGCDPAYWFDHTEHHTRRAGWAKRENRHYPEVIIYRWQPLYYAAQWGGPVICERGES